MDDEQLVERVARAMWEADLRWLRRDLCERELEQRWCRLWYTAFKYERESLDPRARAAIAVMRAQEAVR
jgi:hypothetical protein